MSNNYPIGAKQNVNKHDSALHVETFAEDCQTFFMYRAETPKKPVKKRVNQANDCCRMCKCFFNVKYGTGKCGRMSTQNLYVASNRDGSRGEILASMCENIGVTFIKSPSLSERVCLPCGRKIRNLCKLFVEIKKVTGHGEAELEDLDNVTRNKRQLPTSVSTPDRSPTNRKVTRTNREREVPSSRKSLFSEACHDDNETSNISGSQPRKEDLLLEHSNIDDLLGNKETMVKVIIVHPNDNVVVRTPADKQSKNLVKNISLKNWKAAANGVFAHDMLRKELPAVLQRVVSAEFKEYTNNGSDSILKGTEPDQLAGFSSKLVLKEIEMLCPLWNASIQGACGNLSINSIALCSSVAARARNATMSALAYRISTVLFHAGVGFDDMKRLNRMGVCMSPDRVVNLQRKMGEHFDAKVYVWKRAIESNRTTLAFLEEVEDRQVPKFEEDEMEVETAIYLGEDTVKGYATYQPETLENAETIIRNIQEERREEHVTDDTLRNAIEHLKGEHLPLFK